MKCDAEVFVVSTERPTAPPCPPRRREVEAATRDGLREALRAQLEGEGLRVRAISFGPAGLVAYVEGDA